MTCARSASTALEADAAIDAVRLRDDTIYVVTEPAAGVITRMGGPAVACGRIATVWMCTTAAAHRAWAGDAPFDSIRHRPRGVGRDLAGAGQRRYFFASASSSVTILAYRSSASAYTFM